jgi:hypothetical protein
MDVSESGPMFARLGYQFMAVTDHNMAPDEEQWRIWQEQAGLILVPGEENGDRDHILEIGVHQLTPTPNDNFVERAAALRSGDGFVVACHPQQYDSGPENVTAAAEPLHAFEIYNGLRELRGLTEATNIELWDEMLTAGKQIWGIAADDFHFAFMSPGHGWVCVQVPEEERDITWSLIVDQLKAGAFFASTSPHFTKIVLEGNELQVGADSFVERLQVIGPGGAVLHQVAGDNMIWQCQPGLTYFRIEAIAGIKRAWSQPLYPA